MARVVVALLLVAGLGSAAYLFGRSNAGVTDVELGFHRWEEVPLWLALVSAFGCGLVLMGVVAVYGSLRASLTERRYRKTVAGLESEIHQLRNLPLAPEGSPLMPGDSDDGLPVSGESLRGST